MIDILLNRLIGILIITHQLKSGLVVAHLQAHSQVLNGVNRQLTWPPAGLNNTHFTTIQKELQLLDSNLLLNQILATGYIPSTRTLCPLIWV